MAIISKEIDYDGFAPKADRLSLSDLVAEARSTITSLDLRILEKKHANGTRGLRQSIDANFEALGGWSKLTVGGIDWKKENHLGASVGVEVQVSGRSDMLAVDIMHLRDDLVKGNIDIGIIVVPDDKLSRFLTDRTPNLATAIKHVEHQASDLPIRLVAFSHAGIGNALPKMRTNLGRQK